jgi:hypothetical protein
MAGDWIQWVKGLSRRREVIVLAGKLGMSRREAACACMEMWEWADDETTNGNIKGISQGDIDLMLGIPGFSDALASREVGWAIFNAHGVTFPRFERNNGESAKRRAIEAKKKKRQRKSNKLKELTKGHLSPEERDKRPDDVPEKQGPEERREEERKEEKHISDRTDRGRSDLDFRSDPPPLDLSGVDWSEVEYLARQIGKAVTPASDEDRRAFMRYAVLAQSGLSTDWLVQGIGAINSEATTKTRAARLVGALQKGSGLPAEDFNTLARRVKIPDDVWAWEVLEVRK